MARYEFEGRSAAEAAIKACEELHVTRAALRYEVVSETGAGIERRVVIAIEHVPGAPVELRAAEVEERGREWRDDSRRDDSRRDEGRRGGRSDRDRGRGDRGGRDRDRSRGERGARGGRGDRDRGWAAKRPAAPQEADDGFEALLKMDQRADTGSPRPDLAEGVSARAAQAKTVANEILRLMTYDARGVVVQDDAEEVHIDIRGGDAKRVIGKKGEPLLSLQFLINRMVTRENESAPVVVLDVAGYRERRRTALADLARQLARRAVEEHKVVKLSPMSAHDRRVFHLTLTEMGGVTTQSEGEGLFRRLLIIPAEFSSGGRAD